jgi:hypothetical protein
MLKSLLPPSKLQDGAVCSPSKNTETKKAEEQGKRCNSPVWG